MAVHDRLLAVRAVFLCALTANVVAACGGPPTPADAGDDGGAVRRCVDDAECSDHLFCNGGERCRPGIAGADARGCIEAIDVTPCLANQVCSERDGRCVTQCDAAPDADGDGATAITCGGHDCDDSRADVHPGAMEICDDHDADEDCDPTTFGSRDVDGDGATEARCCNGTGTSRACGTDCDDTRHDAHPGADEVCNAHDDDCDTSIDEGVLASGFADVDGDLHGDPAAPLAACIGTGHFSVLGDDCDDLDPRRSPALDEVCDLVDNDCDDVVDESARALTWYADADHDGFGAASSGTRVSCAPPSGYSLLPTDCDDHDPQISPVALERCNARDDDCNGAADYRLGDGDFEDDDGDGAPDAHCMASVADCDDRDPYAFPGASELCDLRDDDCDGTIDEDSTMLDWLPDIDHDRWGASSGAAMSSCAPIAGRVTRGGDCNDASASIHPGEPDGCDDVGVDDDCDTTVDEDALLVASYTDADADGFGIGTPSVACTIPAGRAVRPGDCDDTSASVHPGAAEPCTASVDADCDGASGCADSDCATTVACAGTGIGSFVLVSGPSTPSAVVQRPLDAPLRLRLLDGTGAPVAGAPVHVVASAGAFATPSDTRTSALGEIAVTLYVGMRVGGTYDFTVSSPGATSYVTHASATAAATGSLTTLVGAIDGGLTALPSPALATRFDVGGVAYLPDGTIAVSGRACVMLLNADGELGALVGVCRTSGSAAPSGDGGPIASATLASAGALSLDPSTQILYVADPLAGQVRAADLARGTISTIATGLSGIEDLDIGPDHAAYATRGGGIARIFGGVVADHAVPTRIHTGHDADFRSDTRSATFTPAGDLVLSAVQRCGTGAAPEGGLTIGTWSGPSIYDEPHPILGGCAGPTLPTQGSIVHTSRLSSDLFVADEGVLNDYDAVSMFAIVTLNDARITSVRQMDAARGDVVIAAGTHVLRVPGIDHAHTLPVLAPSGAPLSGNVWLQTDVVTSCPRSVCDCSGGAGPEGTQAWRARVRALDPGASGGAANYDCRPPYPASARAYGGPRIGTQHFEVGIDSLYGSPLAPTPFTIDVSLPPAGTYAEIALGSGIDPNALAGSSVAIGDIAMMSDGRFYFSTPNTTGHVGALRGIYRTELDGRVTRIAGLSADTSAAGDGGPAIGATIGDGGAYAVALDETGGLLYFDDVDASGRTIVRVVDVGASTISTYVGGGSQTVDGPRLAHQLDHTVYHMHVSPMDRSLWIGGDTTLVRIDASSGLVSRPYPIAASCAGAIALHGCPPSDPTYGGGGCDVALEADGSIDVAGSICTTSCGAVNGIMHVPTAGPPTLVLGACSGYAHISDRSDAQFPVPIYALGLRQDGMLLASVSLGFGSFESGGIITVPLDLAAYTELVARNTYHFGALAPFPDGGLLLVEDTNNYRGSAGLVRLF